jgi:hypothetical protein
MNKERSYFERSQGATSFDPELQSDADVEAYRATEPRKGNEMPNWTQVSGVVDRVILIGLTWLASKGYITTTDVANYATMILAVAGAGYAFWINRNSNLVNRASSVPNTTIVTSPDISAALPQSNVVSTDDKKVVSK